MTFDEASKKLTDLINGLKSAKTATEIADAKSALSDFRAEKLPLSDKTLRPLRKIARAVLEEYEGVVTDMELKAIKRRTSNYNVLVAKLKQINQDNDAAELAPKLEAANNLISITQKAVETVKDIRETGIDKLTDDELKSIDELLALITAIPDRLIS
jgi:flagellar biosynthesis/type III secretory pathway chaperone